MSVGTLSWLDDLRAKGRARFAETGLPSRKDEAWKFTGLNKLRALGLEPSGPPHGLSGLSGSVGPLPNGVALGSLAELLRRNPAIVERHLGKLIDVDRRPMAALNTAWIEDGLVLIVPDGVVLDRPIETTWASTGNETVYPRHLIVLGRAAEAVIVERHSSKGGFSNSVFEIALGAGANLRHYALHEESEAALVTTTIAAEIGRAATYQTFALTAGGGLVRREIEARLVGEGGSVRVDGAYLVDGRRHADTTVLVDHRVPHCSSRQTQKGIVDDHGHAVFQGKILVRPGAQQTDGNQSSQTLLLSRDAEIDVKPELEIHADDVKCSHGATSGRLDENALFYLRSRGVPEREARALLIQGFIDGALDEIDHEGVRETFKAAAAGWLAKRVAA
ncbi:MAG TPA: Fe-S cluster assembly protein SufD [Alphaproteobacteria bacterium]|nr:Fe-S cluster assembly protein SufD [Alphaproteobacteria bacterium]